MQRTLLVWLLVFGTAAEAGVPNARQKFTQLAAESPHNAAGNSNARDSSNTAPNADKDKEKDKGNSAKPSVTDSSNAKETPEVKPSAPKPDPDPDYQAALEHVRAKRYSEAGKILKTMTKDDLQNNKASLLIGTIYYRMKKLKKAKKYFDRVEEPVLSKDTAFAYGATYLEFEDYTKALKGLRANLKLKGPNRDLTSFKVGVCYYKRAQYSRAERYFAAIKPKTLPRNARLERQRYLAEIWQRHDELLSSFGMNDGDVRSLNELPADFDGGSIEDDWSNTQTASNWRLRWKPHALLKQESNQSLNQAHGRDSSDLIVHKVGTKAYAGGDPSAKTFGSLEFGFGFAGFDVRTEQSRSFVLPGISGEFLGEKKQWSSEKNIYVGFQPLLSFELSPAIHADLGAGYTGLMPHGKISRSWGQSEVFTRIRAEGKELDGGVEIALQQPFDEAKHDLANDTLVKADINQRLGDMSLRLNVQDWRSDNTQFTAFDRNRMMLLDGRFKYHLGFESESKLGVSGSMTFGEIGIRASYDFTTRRSKDPLERLDPVDDPETVAKESNKRMFAVSFPIWDVINITAAAGTQNLSGYTYRLRDPATSAVTKEYSSELKQTLIQLGLGVSLVDWIKIRLNYAVEKNSYLNREAQDDAFQLANPRTHENSLMHVELSKSF